MISKEPKLYIISKKWQFNDDSWKEISWLVVFYGILILEGNPVPNPIYK